MPPTEWARSRGGQAKLQVRSCRAMGLLQLLQCLQLWAKDGSHSRGFKMLTHSKANRGFETLHRFELS